MTAKNADARDTRSDLGEELLAARERCDAYYRDWQTAKSEAESWRADRNKWRARCEREGQEWSRMVNELRQRNAELQNQLPGLTATLDEYVWFAGLVRVLLAEHDEANGFLYGEKRPDTPGTQRVREALMALPIKK